MARASSRCSRFASAAPLSSSTSTVSVIWPPSPTAMVLGWARWCAITRWRAPTPFAAPNPLLAVAAGSSAIARSATEARSAAASPTPIRRPSCPRCCLRSTARSKPAAPGHSHVIPADALFEGFLTTSLRPDELLTAVQVPAWPAGTGWSFQEFSRRSGDFAIVGVAATVRLDGNGSVDEARLAFSGVDRCRCDLQPPKSRWPAPHRRTISGLRLRRAAAGSSPPATSTARCLPQHLAAVLAERALQRPTTERRMYDDQATRSADSEREGARGPAEARKTLADFLREDLQLTGTHSAASTASVARARSSSTAKRCARACSSPCRPTAPRS